MIFLIFDLSQKRLCTSIGPYDFLFISTRRLLSCGPYYIGYNSHFLFRSQQTLAAFFFRSAIKVRHKPWIQCLNLTYIFSNYTHRVIKTPLTADTNTLFKWPILYLPVRSMKSCWFKTKCCPGCYQRVRSQCCYHLVFPGKVEEFVTSHVG